MAIHGRTYLRFGGLRSFRQEFGGLDDHSVETVAALNSLFVNHGLLHRMQRTRSREFLLSRIPRRQTFKRRDGFTSDVGNRCHA